MCTTCSTGLEDLRREQRQLSLSLTESHFSVPKIWRDVMKGRNQLGQLRPEPLIDTELC
jgi:hypothetical protein